MNKFEKNLLESFRRVRHDIVKLQEQVLQLSETQARLVEESTMNRIVIREPKSASNKVPYCKPKKHSFIASKTGKKFHIPACIFTKNIKPKSKLTFKSKDAALNQGYKPCDCVK